MKRCAVVFNGTGKLLPVGKRNTVTGRLVKSSVPWILRFCLTHQLLNFITRPDFAAYKYADRKNLSNFLVRRLWGVQGVSWTLKTQAEYDTAVSEGYLPIFESFTP